MTTISARIVADSVSPAGKRLTTMQLRYPRFIHAEFMTHRQFSRNASSSRAIPVERLIADVLDDPAVPMFWGRNQKGMQAGEECNEKVLVNWDYEIGEEDWRDRAEAWLLARDDMVRIAEGFMNAGYHKQIVNRLLEPFAHINVVVTATEWANFFALRDHPDAEPHIALLARRMREAMGASTPRLLRPGEWHVPYVDVTDADENEAAASGGAATLAVKLSVARCARVSYLTHDGKKPAIADDLDLYERLVGSTLLHASPAEHQATPDEAITDGRDIAWTRPDLHGNLVGWCQFRKSLPNECVVL